MALISHVAFLKNKDIEREDSVKREDSIAGVQKGKRLNKTNEEAYFLIASGALG